MTTTANTITLTRAARRRARISLTPLIDVVFILLVFFMLASSFSDWRSIRLEATGEASGAPGVEGAMLVDVTAEGVRLSGAPITLEALAVSVTEALSARPEQRFFVRPRDDVAMQRLVTVLDVLDAAGVANVALLPDARR